MLPLTAEEESPFPTLQEVEEMSNQQIKLAHGNRVLPEVDNPMWKNAINETPAEPSNETPADESTNATDELPSSENVVNNLPTSSSTQSYIGHKIPEEFLIKAGLVGNETEHTDDCVEPLYKLKADGTICGKCN